MELHVLDPASVAEDQFTIFENQKGNFYTNTATLRWLRHDNQVQFSPQVVKDIYNSLEREGFPPKDIQLLENLQYLERYLWPNYNEDSADELVISIAMMVTAKKGENLPLWAIFEATPLEFSSLFRRILVMSLSKSLPLIPRAHILSFIISAFQSLDSTLVRKECALLVSIGIWENFHSEEAREAKMRDRPHLRKAWRAAEKKKVSVDQRSKARIHFERCWLYLLLLEFVSILYSEESSKTYESRLYSERMVEFLTDLLSQLPTRRYVHGLLEDLQILPCIMLSPLYALQKNEIFHEMLTLFEHFYYFQDGSTDGSVQTAASNESIHRRNLATLQQLALQVSRRKLSVLGLANFASISQKEELSLQLSSLNEFEVSEIYRRLCLRKSYPDGVPCLVDRNFMLCALVEKFSKRPSSVDLVKKAYILPTERIFSSKWHPNNEDNREGPFPLPKLNLQYLSITDFLWRAFYLHRSESFFEISRDIEDQLRKLKPIARNGTIKFIGNSKMAARINRLSILEEAPPRVGETMPAYIRAELDLNLDSASENTKQEWDSLRSEDVVFLLNIRVRPPTSLGQSSLGSALDENVEIGLLRCAEVIQTSETRLNSNLPTTTRRKFHIRLDRNAYITDKKNTDHLNELYGSLNLIIRRRGIENNFKAVLTSIQSLMQNPKKHIPEWLRDTYLGCGDPSNACFPKLQPVPKKINFGDTFLDVVHLQETLSKIPLDLHIPNPESLEPPFVLTSLWGQNNGIDGRGSSYEVSCESNEMASPKRNPMSSPPKIRYTGAQVEAIISGTNPGLSLIVGPPGTGKTDVVTQIIANLYANFPDERTLVIAHSNQSLNQIFQKLALKNLDERHLLRLGHGEDDSSLHTSPVSGHGKPGRIESVMDLRAKLLAEVDRISESIGAPGAHGNSCETASYFHQAYIKPLWETFKASVALSPCIETVINEFPFSKYFLARNQPFSPVNSSFEQAMISAEYYIGQVMEVFVQLEGIMPFELLRQGRDKANYLLNTEARIIAMTSTHAAIKRDDIIGQGFRFENVVMEEAAQLTEIETFLPLTLQDSQSNRSRIKRIILCGDHLQNPPIVQNTHLRYFANLEQSLFARFVRLGVPTVNLDQQGRARPSIASLYSWRYPDLGNLDYLYQDGIFLQANAGFRHEYQFIDVGDFKGHGEQEPSPHFIQNLGEAEYSVALFQYMRLLGYPASKISILASYSGQRALIRDIIDHRCANNPLFGSPAHITTIDKFQGEQNDYIIVSLVRTNRVGYLRDVRRLTVCLSRARLGLYILGRLRTFQTCYELKGAFAYLLQKPTNLELTTGEMWPAERLLTSSIQATVIEGVEHLGKYVFEMTQARLQQKNPN